MKKLDKKYIGKYLPTPIIGKYFPETHLNSGGYKIADYAGPGYYLTYSKAYSSFAIYGRNLIKLILNGYTDVICKQSGIYFPDTDTKVSIGEIVRIHINPEDMEFYRTQENSHLAYISPLYIYTLSMFATEATVFGKNGECRKYQLSTLSTFLNLRGIVF